MVYHSLIPAVRIFCHAFTACTRFQRPCFSRWRGTTAGFSAPSLHPPQPDSVAPDFATRSALGTSCASLAQSVKPGPALDVPVPSPHAHFERGQHSAESAAPKNKPSRRNRMQFLPRLHLLHPVAGSLSVHQNLIPLLLILRQVPRWEPPVLHPHGVCRPVPF